MSKQIWKIWFDLDTHTLICYRIDGNGKRLGGKTRWEIKIRSNLPRGLFFHIKGYVQRLVNGARKRGSDVFRKAVFRGLCEAAEACGCVLEVGTANADLVWMLRGVPLIAFQIHDGSCPKPHFQTGSQ